MVQEITPLSVGSDGNLRVTFVPAGSNAKSAAILNGATAKSLTYSLTPSGYNRSTTENSIEDARLSLKTTLSRPGTKTNSLELQYVWGDVNDIAKVALVEGTTGSIVVRWSTPNATDYVAAQKADIIPIQMGAQRKDAPTANGLQTITQMAYIIGVPEDDATLVA